MTSDYGSLSSAWDADVQCKHWTYDKSILYKILSYKSLWDFVEGLGMHVRIILFCPLQLLFPFTFFEAFLQFGCMKKNHWAVTLVMKLHLLALIFFCGNDAVKWYFLKFYIALWTFSRM